MTLLKGACLKLKAVSLGTKVRLADTHNFECLFGEYNWPKHSMQPGEMLNTTG